MTARIEDRASAEFEADCLAAYTAELMTARETWPHACRSCSGSGFAYYDHPQDGWEICDVCVAEGRCPRCGQQAVAVTDETEEMCTSCGWAIADGFATVLPVCPL